MISGTIIIIHIIALIEDHSDLSLRSAQKRFRISLFFAALFGLATLVVDGALEWKNWKGFEADCARMPAALVMCYIIQKQFVYFFLYDRAKIVHNSLKLNYKLLVLLRWALILTILAGVPVFFYWIAYVSYLPSKVHRYH